MATCLKCGKYIDTSKCSNCGGELKRNYEETYWSDGCVTTFTCKRCGRTEGSFYCECGCYNPAEKM